MALFQKKPQVSSSAPIYTLGLNKTILIVGLGNDGKEFQGTRHNVGFMCADTFVDNQKLGSWVKKKDLKVIEASGSIGPTRIIVIKPTTLMNNSGVAVQATMHFYKIPLENVLIIHDELDIPFGQIRLRIGGSDAGNNGIKSVIQHIGSNFGRVRVGIKNNLTNEANAADFVLDRFSKEEEANLNILTREVNAILTEYLYGDALPRDTRSFLS